MSHPIKITPAMVKAGQDVTQGWIESEHCIAEIIAAALAAKYAEDLYNEMVKTYVAENP